MPVELEPPDHCDIVGQVKGDPPAGASVEAVWRTLSDGSLDEQVVADGMVTGVGWYRMRYRCPPTSGLDGSLSVRLRGPGGEVIVESAPVHGPGARVRIDLRPSRAPGSLSEYAALEQEIAETLESGAAGLDGAEDEALDEVSEWLDVDADRLRLFQESRACEQELGLPSSAFYALGRQGLDLSVDDLLDIPVHELRTTLTEAVADGIVDAGVLGDIETLVEQLAEQVVDRATRVDRDQEGAGLVDVLEAADIPRDTIAQVLRRYQGRTGESSEFWESFAENGEAEEVGDEAARDVGVAIELAEVLGPDASLLRTVHGLRHEGRWQTPEDLASLSFDEWCDLIEGIERDTDGEEESEEDVHEMAEARAGVILDALEEAYPSAFIRRRLSDGEALTPGAREVMGRAGSHDFMRGSIRERVATEPALIEGLDADSAEAAVEEIEAVERVSRITDNAEEVATLMQSGIRSATEVAGTPKRAFIEAYAEALGGRAQAARVHAQAQQTAAGSKMAALRLVQAVQHMPIVLGAPPDIKGVPDAQSLFQAAGAFCDCDHCGSVYSPAAYLVDLLRYLQVSTPERLNRLNQNANASATLARLKAQQPLDVLLARRPDLADLPLTCENTLTPLPYIDLVNELLEARITGGSAAYDTGKAPADVLRAVPQHLSREAYQRLQQAVHPLTLPYHQPLALARAYLGHLGVSRLELMRTLGKGETLRLALAAESLAMSPDEFLMVAQPPAELWRHFGFARDAVSGTTYVSALSRVPVLLEAAGITFQTLIDLVSTRVLNADQQLHLDTPAPDCNPNIVTIAGLDESRLALMVRLIRLQRRLGWPFALLDRAMVAFASPDPDAAVLEKLATARDVAARLDWPLAEVLVLWAPLDAWGPDNQFDKLFATRAVMWRADDERAFQLRPDRMELARTAESLDQVTSALLAGFRITSDEFARIRALLARRGTTPRLDVAGLSAIQRVVVLSRALQLGIPALDLVLRLTPPEADPFRPGDPDATRKFIDIVRDIQASDFTAERLAYLFRHESEPRRDPAPVPAQVESVLGNIRRGLADAFAETSQPSTLSADLLRQKLGALVDTALLDTALEILDPRTAVTAQARREFFDRHLARFFTDPSAAAQRLLAPAADQGREALDARWQSSMQFVLAHVLPHLRVRQLRGAIIQTLSDSLGMSVPVSARLLDGVMKARERANAPLLHDFLSLLGTGLTGAYFANADLSGEPALVRVDPELAFSWGSASPAEGVPGTNFSVRWSGRFVPRLKAVHTFYLQTDGAVRLVMKVDGTEQVLIDQPASPGKLVEVTSSPIALDPTRFAEVRLEYRNTGGPGALTLQVGTGPGAKQAVPTPSLYPTGGLTSFAPVEQSYRRLHKAALLITGFGMTDAQVEWLTTEPAFLSLDVLPMAPPSDAEALALFRKWRHLAALYALRKKLPRSNLDLFEVFRSKTLPEAVDRIVLAAGWDRQAVEAFLGADGLGIESVQALLPDGGQEADPAIVRLARAVDVQRRVGIAPATLAVWANGVPDADGATAIVQAVKARYDETRWLEVARALNDPLRAERRDALVAYLLPRMRETGVTNRNQLFEYFLIDVDMNPCMLTSRVRQGIGSVQTFFQRCLMNLEPKVPPRIIDDSDWKFLKTFRVWEVSRKIFLHPENVIEPELRDDKSPLFQVLERTILQQEIKSDNVEAAFGDYLEGLDEIARLDVRAVWFEERPAHRMAARQAPKDLHIPPAPWSEWDSGTYHVFARTFNAPHLWYYRRLESGRAWTAWEKIDVEIEGDHLVPVVFQRRMHLVWALFREVSKPPGKMERKGEGAPPPLGKDWEIQLAYSVYDRGKWSRKRLSSGGVVDVGTFLTGLPGILQQRDGTCAIPQSAYTLRATVTESGDLPQLHLHVYSRAVEGVIRGTTREQAELTMSPTQVELVARFGLDGCSGALHPDRPRNQRRAVMSVVKSIGRVKGKRKANAAIGNVRRAPGRSHAFRTTDGGAVNAPTGYRVDGMGYTASRKAGGALLALPAADTRGVAVVLPAKRSAKRDAWILPVENPKAQGQRGLYPFFFQDRFRSYFVRPIYADWRPPVQVAVPVLARRPLISRAVRKGRPAVAPKRPVRGGRGRREDVAPDEALAFESQDAWEDYQDEAWHPDDAAEARKPRQRQTPPTPAPPPARRSLGGGGRPAARPAAGPAAKAQSRPGGIRPMAALRKMAPRLQLQRREGYHERRLQFTPFEHPDTCLFMATLKAKGVEGLLDFATTRPPKGGRDHVMQPDGTWARRQPGWFQRKYGLGPLVFARNLPHLDVAFEADSPYGGYNWELFFHAPLQVAVRLAKDGRHEEAQRWFHFIFDPTTDSSAPSPKRYWRFAPFHDNNEYDSARAMMNLLSYSGKDPQLIDRQNQVRAQLAAWWEKPFSPHVIARLRISAYQKAVVMKYIDNLVEWGDKLFRRDTMETIQEATQIYILAANILGPRPEKIPPIVSRPPMTFRAMRNDLNLFSNVEVRMENLQVRRPFRITAQPDSGGARLVLGMATQYFCTPANPQLDKYWDTVADRLFKIRNCMNIQGIVRQLPLFDPPIDPGLLVRAAAAGVDLGSVIASLNAPPPHHRFRVLLGRAVRLAEEIRTFGAMALQILEKRDAEGLASLRASNETALTSAVRDIRKKQVRQVEEALNELNLHKEHIDIQIQHLNQQLSMLMNPQEEAAQKSITAAQVVSGIAEGVDLVSKVMHAIPEFQTGAAGGFSSPFVTLQLGGQMLGDIASAFAASFEKVKSKHEAESALAAAQAEYQRRREEWQHELDLLMKEKAQIDKRIVEQQLKLEIAGGELRRHELEVDNSKKIEGFLREKYTNQQLYGWMLGQLSGTYFQVYKVAFDAAQQAERAFRFERGETSSSFIEFSYWDSLRNGLLAGERLLLDLRRLEAAHLDGDRRLLEVTRHLSLRQDYPQAFVELMATGRCQIAVSEALLDGDFPGHYFRRVKTMSLSVTGNIPWHANVNCTLTLLDNRIRTGANASGSYAQSADADDSRFLVNLAPIQAVATSRPDADAGVFHLRFDDDRYLPFEGAGAISTWRLELHQADNAVDLSRLTDIIVSMWYTAKFGGAALESAARADREKGLSRGGLKPDVQRLVSVRREFPDVWKRLEEGVAGQDVEVALPLEADGFSPRFRGLDLRVERVTAFAQPRAPLAADALRLRLDPPKGSGTPLSGWAPPWPQAKTVRATSETSGAAGVWKLAAGTTGGKLGELVDDLLLVFDLRARRP